MVERQPSLKGLSVAVVGFNARPIACSAKRAGAKVYVSDYWGDSDLAACCHEWISVLQPRSGLRQREILEKPVPLLLVDKLQELVEGKDIDYVLVGSGFDDCSVLLKPLHEKFCLQGNTPGRFQAARNMKLVRKIAMKNGLRFPNRIHFRDYESALNGCEKIGYPCIIRPVTSGGGAGIVLVRTASDILQFFKHGASQQKEGIVQQYVRGIDVSCSVLSTGFEATTISFHGQLIGIPSAGRNCDFAYSGNYQPVNRNPEVVELGRKAAANVCADLSLVGSNGIDMVVDSENQLWIMEVNPRIQGTLELLETSGDMSVTGLHHMSCNGELPSNSFSFSPAVKMIIYARRSGVVSDLSVHENVVDRTPAGVCVNRGDPICSVIAVGSNLRECYFESCSTSFRIQSSLI